MAGMGKVSAGQGVRRQPVIDSYARLSWKLDAKELEKIDTQHADNATVIERSGGVAGELFEDGLSAWKKDVHRPGWERVLARLESGESDGVCVWNTDRLLRRSNDLAKLIELGDAGYRVLSAQGEYNLADADHRFVLRILVAQAEKQSDDAQRRIRRRLATLREHGVAHFRGRTFGFGGRDLTWTPPEGFDPETDEWPQVSPEVVGRERAALRSGTQALLVGVSQNVLAAEWNASGVRTVNGKEWVAVTVRLVLLRPRNAGVIEHEGQVVGRMPGEPIVDPEEFERLRAMFTARRRGRRPGQVYVGSSLVECGLCGKGLSGRPHNGTYRDTGAKRRQYACVKKRGGCGKVAADARAVDTELRKFTVRRLSDPRHAATVATARARVSERLTVVAREIALREEIQEGLSERLGRLEITPKAFDKANKPLVEALKPLYAERDALSAEQPIGPARAQAAESVGADWDDGDDVTKQRGLLTQALGDLRLALDPARAKGGRGGFDTARLRPIPPTGTA